MAIDDFLRPERVVIGTSTSGIAEGEADTHVVGFPGCYDNQYTVNLMLALALLPGIPFLPFVLLAALSGAAARVAEGGAEAVPLVRAGPAEGAMALLRSAGFALAATVVEGGDDLFAAALPRRLVYVIGAEGEGMDRGLAAACDLRLSIPGTGAVESLNVSAATAILLATWSRP